jgi:hypothetical protein
MKFILDGKRWDTDKMEDLDIQTREEGGNKINGIYLTPKSKRIFVNTYSIWASGRNDGTVVGDGWHEADADEIARLADRFGGKLFSLVPQATGY